jgi:4-diphosphocytidyl-2-C-methyl-D-erythritol kinase
MFVTWACDIKINLALRILDKRGDGYHDICSLFWRLRSPETLDVRIGSDSDRLTVLGASIPGENILSRTCWHIRSAYGLDALPPVDIRLYKRLPMGGGVGAGSGNAAALIRCFNALSVFGDESLPGIGALGADVAFLASDHALAIARGVGDILEGIDGDLQIDAVIFFPEWSSDTARAYSALDEERIAERVSAPLKADEARDEAMWVLDRLRNGLWAGLLPNDFIPVVGHEEQYGALIDAARSSGALAWGLCGSGSAYFSLFARENSACGIASLLETIEKKEKNEFQWLRQILVLE